MLGGWLNIERNPPPVGEEVNLRYMITGTGAPEREGWISKGSLRKSGNFNVHQNKENTVTYNKPTHWKKL